MRIASNKHDIVALKVFDPVEMSIPDIGLIKVSDAESGAEKWIDTSSKSTRNNYEKWWISHIELIKNIFKRCGVDSTELRTDLDYVKPLIKLFKKR
jgi:hypothetical protein